MRYEIISSRKLSFIIHSESKTLKSDILQWVLSYCKTSKLKMLRVRIRNSSYEKSKIKLRCTSSEFVDFLLAFTEMFGSKISEIVY